MRNFENVLVIYPVDPTIDFLQPVYDKVISLFPECQAYRPLYGATLHSLIDDETELIIFIGHGTPSGLYGSVNETGDKKIICDISGGTLLFNDCALVLFSCNSIDFLKKIRRNPVSINNFVVFGDMPTDSNHIKHNQDNDSTYWTECNAEQLDYYSQTLVESVISGLEKGHLTNSFHGFYKGANRTINSKINDIIRNRNWTRNQKLQLIERLVEVKTDIDYSDSIL